MGRPRTFDYDRARQLRAEGLTYAVIGKMLGVSAFSVSYACDPTIRQRHVATVQKQHRSSKKSCVDCGIQIYPQSERCVDCSTKRNAKTVREDTLYCRVCTRWLSDECFPRDRNQSARRGRDYICRECQAFRGQIERSNYEIP